MSESRDLKRRLAEYYAGEAPSRAPDWVLRDSLAAIETTKQRRLVMGVPRRFYLMSTNLKLAAALVAVIALGAAGFRLLAVPAGPGGGPTPTPSVTTTAAPTPTVTPRPSFASTGAPPLTGTHVSPTFGFTVSYPAGWTVRVGTQPWTTHALAGFGSPLETADYIMDPTNQSQLFIMLASHPLGGESGTAWEAAVAAQPDPGPCTTFDAVVVSGLPGRIYSCDEPMRALFWNADRGYVVSIYRSSDLAGADATYDLAWFKGLLATVRLQ
jgi:hypothetical protein